MIEGRIIIHLKMNLCFHLVSWTNHAVNTITFVLSEFSFNPYCSLMVLNLSIMVSSSSFQEAGIRVSSAYLRLLISPPPIVTPPFHSSNTLRITCSLYTLNNRGYKIHPCHTPTLVLNLLDVELQTRTVAVFWYCLFKSSTKCCGTPISSSTFHIILRFTQSKALE